MMYAIVEIAGQQFKVEEGKKIFVHRLDAEGEKKVEFDQVLLIDDDGKITIGEPVIKDAVIEGKVLDHVRGDKVIVFKKKRKKGYRVKNGHRQNFTEIEIVSISGAGTAKKKATRKAAHHAAADENAAEETAAKTVAAEDHADNAKKTTKKSKPAEDKAE